MNTNHKAACLTFSAALACAAVFGAAGASSAATAPMSLPSMTQTAEVTISISGFAYTVSGPVAPGATVTVVNMDSEVHTVTGQGSGSSFDSGTIAGGGTGTFTAPNSPGEYEFVCIFHGNMRGTLVVQEASAPTDDEDDQDDNTNPSQMDEMPVGGADTGAESEPGGNLGLVALGSGFILLVAAGGTYIVRKHSNS